MFLIACAGFGFTKAFKFGKSEQQFVSKILLYFINPCLIVSHFNLDFDVIKLRNLSFTILVSFIVHFVLILVSLIFISSKKNNENCGIERLGIVFTNCAFIGIPLIEGVLGKEGVFYLLGYIVVFNIVLWTVGYLLLGGKINIKKILFNPNIIAIFAGVLLFISPYKLPSVIFTPISLIGGMNTATSMILLGMLFANFKFPENQEKRKYFFEVIKVCIVRLVVCAVFVFFVILAFNHLFNFVDDCRLISFVVFISALCPVGMSVSTFSILFEKDESFSGLLVMSTSLFSILTIPVFVKLGELFFR